MVCGDFGTIWNIFGSYKVTFRCFWSDFGVIQGHFEVIWG